MLLTPEIMKDSFRLSIHPKGCNNGSQALNTAWYKVNNKTEVQEELVLGMTMVTNAWHLMEAGESGCLIRNLCEMGFNGSVWGDMAEVVVELMGQVMARWSSEGEGEEIKLVEALKQGIEGGRKFREGEKFKSCDGEFLDVCSLDRWNSHVVITKHVSHS